MALRLSEGLGCAAHTAHFGLDCLANAEQKYDQEITVRQLARAKFRPANFQVRLLRSGVKSGGKTVIECYGINPALAVLQVVGEDVSKLGNRFKRPP